MIVFANCMVVGDYFRFEVETKKMPAMNTTDILSV